MRLGTGCLLGHGKEFEFNLECDEKMLRSVSEGISGRVCGEQMGKGKGVKDAGGGVGI